MRYAELESELHRVFAVLKMRFSDFDRTLRVYTIREGVGVRLVGLAPRAVGLLTGVARPLPDHRGGSVEWRPGA